MGAQDPNLSLGLLGKDTSAAWGERAGFACVGDRGVAVQLRTGSVA